ncbi:MAG: electron transport complex subunit RsxC [Bacteroidales bacterium]|nr:electron transport complex subunit RsxC [Bacteroidales bacterium]
MLKTFTKGGVHPPENKLSARKKIQNLPLPETAIIPLGMHLGVPAKCLVNKGDEVKVGQLLASADGFVSANIHSPFSGTVLKIDKALDASGYKRDAVFIGVKGDEWLSTIDTSTQLKKDCRLDPAEIIHRINEAGIVGLGGATFPSHVKLTIPRGKKAEYLLINGVECEPYLTSDHVLMLEKGEELVVGVSILMRALNVEQAVIGIENNKPDAIAHLREIVTGFPNISVQALQVKYPQGGEKQLIKAVLNREVPSGGLPVDVGAVVFNVGTAVAVYDAVQKNKPLIERVVTITGKSLTTPANYRVRFGTPVSALIEAAGGLPEDTGKVINGGPMMGKALADPGVPVVKGSSGILILPEPEAARRQTEPCIRCSRCVSVCPMGLEPYLLMVLGQKSLHERMENEKVMDCIECGSCSYTCPSSRPLLDYIRLGKAEVGKMIRSRKK